MTKQVVGKTTKHKKAKTGLGWWRRAKARKAKNHEAWRGFGHGHEHPER